ncbi:MAG: hypothetical protein COB26_11935 [Piscirickettsiaceae bacterium]|nr:MAG: hypothetical protein COB26_11935 [Piscirickettsiaceae bacterium]
MTENEKRAREVLDKALELNISISKAKCIFAEKPDVQSGKTVWPVLTEKESIDVAINYPYSWQEVRQAFL